MGRGRSGGTAIVAALTLLCAGATATPAAAFDVAAELRNFGKVNERARIELSPSFLALQARIGLEEGAKALAAQAADPERLFLADLCWSRMNGCGGDFRLYDWQAKGYGIVEPVLFTARNGATLSGHVWATKAGPAKRPGIVIGSGSVQATENLYWPFAQALAKAGYVVLTYDPQGQGQSDTAGAAPDQGEGVPAQTDGRPFYDGMLDALDFFLSTPDAPFVPRTSCSSGTSHAPKQRRRAAAGLNAAHNPFASLIDASRIGMAGQSFGAGGASYIGQQDPRVKAIVAWDNLRLPRPNRPGDCPAHPELRVEAPITKPALGISNDYGIVPQPYTSTPDPLAKSQASLVYSDRGVDTGELVVRGGTHFETAFISNPAFGATLRGMDLATWYTTAWFDKYVKGDPTADARLLTKRWHADAEGGAVDPTGDGNLLSSYFHSRLDIRRSAGGERIRCETLRTGCPALVDDDGVAGPYSYLARATTPDGPADAAVPATAGLRSKVCTSTKRLRLRAPRRRGARIVRTEALVRGRRVGRATGRAVSFRLRGLPRGTAVVTLRVTERRGGRTVRRTVKRTVRTCAPLRS